MLNYMTWSRMLRAPDGPAGGAAPAGGTEPPAVSSGSAAGSAPAAGATPAAAAAKAGEAAAAAPAAGEGDDDGGFMGAAPDAEKDAAAAAASTVRKEAFNKADGVEARKAAYAALTADEQKAAAAALTADDRKALGIEEPTEGDKPKVEYTDFKVADGLEVDQELMGKAKAKFSELGLTQDQAQALVDFQAGDVVAAVKAAGEQPYNLWRDTQKAWIADVKKDEELGGAKLQATRANAARAIDTLHSPEEAKALREALVFTGATNNPAILRAFARMGARISEGKFVPGAGSTPEQKSPAAVMYGAPVTARE